jgi:hypothetical protein
VPHRHCYARQDCTPPQKAAIQANIYRSPPTVTKPAALSQKRLAPRSTPQIVRRRENNRPAPQKMRTGLRVSTSISTPVAREITLAMAAISDLTRAEAIVKWIAEIMPSTCEEGHSQACLAVC